MPHRSLQGLPPTVKLPIPAVMKLLFIVSWELTSAFVALEAAATAHDGPTVVPCVLRADSEAFHGHLLFSRVSNVVAPVKVWPELEAVEVAIVSAEPADATIPFPAVIEHLHPGLGASHYSLAVGQ